MKKIGTIQITRKELNDLLRDLTEEGKLVGLYEEYESWEDVISFVHDTEEFLDENKTKELLAKHFKVGEILNYLIVEDNMTNDDDTILLVFKVENL